jgi:uncharacterized damage-inducible protein DinB
MKRISIIFTFCLAFTITGIGQQSMTSSIERQFNKIESDILTTAQAMPEAITGDSVRADISDVNGPKSITTKNAIIEYLKDSFAIGRKAIATLTTQNAMDMIDFRWRKLPRLDLAFYALTHANEHYGQMAIYLRMCGIVPPPTLIDK